MKKTVYSYKTKKLQLCVEDFFKKYKINLDIEEDNEFVQDFEEVKYFYQMCESSYFHGHTYFTNMRS